MNVLMIDSNYPINTRNTKILTSLKERNPNCRILVCAWNRELIGYQKNKSYDEVYLYNRKSRLGRRVQKLFNLLGYYKFLKKKNKELNPDIIIASHYDMLFLASFFKTCNQILIYENLDIPTSSKNIILSLLHVAEKRSLKKTDIITFASRFYLPLYKHFKGEKIQLENLPVVSAHFEDTRSNSLVTDTLTRDQSTIQISFIGGVRYVDILKKLILASTVYPNLKVNIHGYGHQNAILEEFVVKENLETKVSMTGRYNYEDIPRLYNNADFIWAVYPNNNYNVKYAISNKFHETILFLKPGIYSKGTELAKLVEEKGLGLTVDPENLDDMKSLFHLISTQKINIKYLKENLYQYSRCSKTWDDEFDEFYTTLTKKLKEK